jgi:hypothetical protein
MNIATRIVKSLRYVLGYGYALSWCHALKNGTHSFVAITQEAIYSTYREKSDSVIENMQESMKNTAYSELGFYFAVKIDSGRVRPFILSTQINNEDGRIHTSDKYQTAFSTATFKKGSKDEKEYIESLNKDGVYIIPVEDSMLTNLPVEMIIEAIMESNAKRIV